jgi:hypothetical protein
MTHHLKIKLAPEDQYMVDTYLSYSKGDNDEVLFDKEYKFDNGNRLALRIINSRGETPWTEGILFSPEGFELALTDCSDSIFGEYVFFVKDDKYVAIVER